MRKKIYRPFAKIFKLVFIFSSLLISTPAFCASSWVLAAEQFSFARKKNISPSDESISKSMPTLILEQLAENLERISRTQEQLDRTLYNSQKERLSLFLQLSKEVQTRDSIFLNNYGKKRLSSKLKDADKKITDIQKKIDNNLLSEKKSIEEAKDKIKIDLQREEEIQKGNLVDQEKEKNSFQKLLQGFIPGKNIEEPVKESVSFYHNNTQDLYVPSKEAKESGYSSYLFEKSCTEAGINGLLSGIITIYGSYLSVAITVYQFPGARVIANAVEVGTTDDLKSLSLSLARSLTPKISDSMPVSLSFIVQPEEAKSSVSVTIDDLVYKSIDSEIIVQGGVHTLQFLSAGYNPVSFSYPFTGSRDFLIEVNMTEDSPGELTVHLKKPFVSDVFSNGVYSGSFAEEESFVPVKINNRAVLSHVIAADGSSADFYIPKNLALDSSFVELSTKALDKNAYIEKRRKWMYASYSSLIVSLIPTFYCYGNAYGAAVAYNNNNGMSYDEALKWQNASNITIGISAACGAFFAYELIRYFIAANSVLPKEVKGVSSKKQEKLKQKMIFEQEQKQKKLEEQEEHAKEEQYNEETQEFGEQEQPYLENEDARLEPTKTKDVVQKINTEKTNAEKI